MQHDTEEYIGRLDPFKVIVPEPSNASLGYADAYKKHLPREIRKCLKECGYDNQFLEKQALTQMTAIPCIQEFDRMVTFSYPHGVGQYVFCHKLCQFVRSKLLGLKSAVEKKPSDGQPKQLLFAFMYE